MRRLTVEVHRHGLDRAIPVSQHVVSVSWTRSIAQPWESATVGFKLPVFVVVDLVRVGDWLVARDRDGAAIFWGHVSDVSGGVSSRGTQVATEVTSVTVESWFAALNRVKVYVPAGWTNTRGTLFNVTDWYAATVPVWDPLAAGEIGASLQAVHRALARVKLPASLGGGYIGEEIPVVWNDDEAKKYAPGRAGSVDPLSVGGGAFPFQLSAPFYQSSVAETYQSVFVPESMLVEMFPSLEAGDALSKDTALGKVLGRQPVLVYRVRPWRSRPLAEAATTFINFPLLTDKVSFADETAYALLQGQIDLQQAVDSINASVARQSLAPSQTLSKLQVLQGSTVNHTAADMQFAVLERLFRKVTWDLAQAKRLVPSAVRSVKFRWNDSNRVNVTSVALAAEADSALEALPGAGLPIADDESVLAHGVRLAKPSVPWHLVTGSPDYLMYMRAYAAQLMQFQWGAHAMCSGEIMLDPPDATGSATVLPPKGAMQSTAVDSQLRAGEILIVKIGSAPSALNCYIDSVTHSYAVSGSGAEGLQCSISYSRGLFEHQEDYIRNPTIPLKKAAPAVQATPNAPRGGAVTQTPGTDKPTEPKDAVAYAELDWNAGLTEADRAVNGRLRNLFSLSDYGAGYVKPKPAHIPWWCGIAVSAWTRQAGLNAAHVQSWYHVRDVEAFFTYGAHPNPTPSRIKTTVNGEPISTAFATAGQPRVWMDSATIRATSWRDLDFRRNDVMLINHQGATNEAQHIVLVRSYDKTTGLLETIEGNAHGLTPTGGRAGTAGDSAVCVNRRHLSNAADFRKVYGVGRPSPLDYDQDLNFT